MNINRSIRVPMSNTHKFNPFQPAFAAGTVVRAGGSLVGAGPSDMTHPTVSTPIHRGLKR